MKVNIEYDPSNPEDVILAERIIKCNAMARVLYKLFETPRNQVTHKYLLQLLDENYIDIQKLWK